MYKLPLVTIVVCTYNGEKRIKDCLDALITQDYPKNRYETIIVDDGSTDKTHEIISKYSVKVVRHKKNLGICSARNTGLQSANGEIIAYTDDDCIARKSWLNNLVKPYRDDVVAVGGLTIPFSCSTIMEKYMAEMEYGNPAPQEFRKSKNPLYRFYIYLKDMFWPITIIKNDPIQVGSIYTLNASFKTKALKEVGGWENGVDFREDSEMCDRLNEYYKKKKILFTKKAIVLHKHRTSFSHFLKQTFLRSESTLKQYLKYKKVPPIFPSPLFILVLTFVAGYLNLFLGILTLIILPQSFYLWWLVRFLRNPKLYYLLFPYMQFSLESATILGMLKGFLRLRLEK